MQTKECALNVPSISLTTTAVQVFQGDIYLDALSFRNGSAAGTIYLRNVRNSLAEVTSTDYDFSLGPGDAIGFDIATDGVSIRGPWRSIGSATVTLEILPAWNKDKRF